MRYISSPSPSYKPSRWKLPPAMKAMFIARRWVLSDSHRVAAHKTVLFMKRKFCRSIIWHKSVWRDFTSHYSQNLVVSIQEAHLECLQMICSVLEEPGTLSSELNAIKNYSFHWFQYPALEPMGIVIMFLLFLYKLNNLINIGLECSRRFEQHLLWLL